MRKKYNIGKKSDMRRFNRDLKKSVEKEFQKEIRRGIEINCPNCNNIFKASKGIQRCPKCSYEIELND